MPPTAKPPELVEAQVNRCKLTLRQRLESLAALRQRIERNKHRLERAARPEGREALLKALMAREELYQKRIEQIRRGRSRLARLERELRAGSRESIAN